MIWILLILDIYCYLFTSYNTFLILIAIPFLKENSVMKLISVGILIDYLILKNIWPTNTAILLFLFILNKYFFKVKKLSFENYILINIFNLILFVGINYFISIEFQLLFFSLVLFQIFFANFLFWIVSYNLIVKFIKYFR